ncbi:MAG: hotdog fold thioesterase [Bacteroidetes bacterium]|jgi:uncharacterized protein (TIGR00369 family)|nr:hotdog fold thioesterase [Bacteroidota bacterium]
MEKENKALKLLQFILESEESYESPSPYMQWLRGRLIRAEEGKVEVSFTVREEMCNPAGILHGGVISGMLDEVAGIAVFSLGRDSFFTSVNLQVDFLRPAQLGEEVKAVAEVIRAGERIIHVETQMLKGDKILAKADTNLITTHQKLPQF